MGEAHHIGGPGADHLLDDGGNGGGSRVWGKYGQDLCDQHDESVQAIQADPEGHIEAEVVAKRDSVDDNQKFKKFEGFLSLFRSSSTRRDPGVYHAVNTAGTLEQIISHVMAIELFLYRSSRQTCVAIPAIQLKPSRIVSRN